MTARARLGVPDLGVGVGLRVPHYGHVLREQPAVDFFEVISENFLVEGGKPRYHLARVLESYRVVPHGVSLGIAGPEPLDREYLKRLKRLLAEVKPPWLSDHFCWSGAGGAHVHDLLPIPYTKQAIERVVERAREVQDFLELRFALENTSSYLSYEASTFSEWAFISEIAERADIGLLLDVNNVYVSAYNHGFDPFEFIEQVPHERVVQIHLAGHTNLGAYIIDTHRGSVIDPVWDLYRRTIELTGSVSTLIEWDDEIPSFDVLMAETEKARAVRDRTLSGAPLEPVPRGVPTQTDASSEHEHGWRQGGPREIADGAAAK
ncbi:MAG TPA: DUF692 domain-containing protein [Polyangiaceae bacterium]|nr:DUF692 domain-containing protein [Polyangiaceae bacterium]